MIAWLTVAIWLGPPSSAQGLQPVGTSTTFEAATWNIEWFGSGGGPSDDVKQRHNAAQIIAESEIDLWAVQEIGDQIDFIRLLNELGSDWSGQLGTHGNNQRTGFIFRKAVVSLEEVGHILIEQDHAFAGRPPFYARATVTLPDTVVSLHLVTLHAKASGDASSYVRRETGANALKAYLDETLSDAPVVVLGDFNDELGRSIFAGGPSPYRVFLDDPARYRFLTEGVDRDDLPTYCSTSSCSSGSTLDHILITDELFTAGSDRTTDRLTEVISEIPSFVSTTSDHLPVYTVFSFPRSTPVENLRHAYATLAVSVHPNPLEDRRGTVNITLPHPSMVHVTLIDLLGRSMALPAPGFLNAGTHHLPLDVSSLSAGTYLVRVEAGHASGAHAVIIP